MYLAQRAVAAVIVVAAAVFGVAAYPSVPTDRPASSNRSSVAAEVASSAEAFIESVRSAVAAGTAPLPRAIVRAVRGSGLRGIDVSHYQGRIDWARVARSGNHFAIAKATEGRTYIDHTYLRNKALAEANHVAFGAYHFARPDRRPHDAVQEANHFLDVARLEPGNVLPVLDLETTGGLSQRRLTRWILTWLRRVRERLGERPMVYTSPLGWAERTGNTTAIADAGFDLLWVAHWGVRRPSLPARDWGGHGWTLWQRSDCGRVPGVRGCVDVNRLSGRSLGALTITVPDTRPPSVRVSRSTSFTSPAAVSFDEAVGGVSAPNVLLRTAAPGRWPSVRLSCLTGIGSYAGCGSGDVRRVLLTPLRPLVPGERYRVVVNPATASPGVADRAGNLAPTVARSFTAPTELEQGSAPIVYARPRAWQVLAPRERSGGRVAVSGVTGSSAELTFRGTGVVWSTVAGPNHGLAAIWVDDRYVRTVDTYARERTVGVRHRVSGLAPGVHTVRILVLGRAAPAASGTIVAVDGFTVLSAG